MAFAYIYIYIYIYNWLYSNLIKFHWGGKTRFFTIFQPFTPNKEEAKMARKIRSDITVGNLEKDRLGVPPGTIRNPDGRDTRSDKKLGTIRKEGEKKK